MSLRGNNDRHPSLALTIGDWRDEGGRGICAAPPMRTRGTQRVRGFEKDATAYPGRSGTNERGINGVLMLEVRALDGQSEQVTRGGATVSCAQTPQDGPASPAPAPEHERRMRIAGED